MSARPIRWAAGRRWQAGPLCLVGPLGLDRAFGTLAGGLVLRARGPLVTRGARNDGARDVGYGQQ